MNALPFAIVPGEVWLDARLTKNQIRVLGALFSFRGRDTGICWPSREALSRRCGVAVDRISHLTTELVRLGWLEKARRFDGFGSRCEYRITVPEIGGGSEPVPPADSHPETSKTDPSEAVGPVGKEQSDLSELDSRTCQVSTGPLKGIEQTKNIPGTDQSRRAGAREDSSVQYDLPIWIPIAIWTAFIDHRKKLRAPMTEKARGLAIRKLTTLRDEGHDPTAVIEQSILNGYRGLFPINASRHSNGRRSLDLYSLDF